MLYVPVEDVNGSPLMPTNPWRANNWVKSRKATPFWSNGIFCVRLNVEPSGRVMQDVVVGIDPGSKREAFTVKSEAHTFLNILADAVDWVKDGMETRRNARRSRRGRKTPCRQNKMNKHKHDDDFLAPSTKARWGAHLRVIDFWKKLIPITVVSVEDIKAETKKNCRKWNKNFSPLEVGKAWFEKEVTTRGYKFYKFQGFETKSQRDYRGFKKTSEKLRDTWDAHNVDSHCLCELAIGDIKPFFGINKCEFLKWHRRQTNAANPQKGGVRKQYGTTRSLGLNRGTLVKHITFGLTYVGGTSKGKLSLHDVRSGKRLTQGAKKTDCVLLSTIKWRTQIPPLD